MNCQNRLVPISTLIMGVFILAGCGLVSGGDLLDGTSWTLTDLAGSSLVEGISITAQFSDGQIGGSSGCNSYGGAYTVNGEKLETADLVSTLMACADTDAMDQEQAFLAYLQDLKTFEIDGNQLKIITADGAELIFALVK